jgi:glycosyltransferase involved in cell wall biosynthesis
MSKRKKPKKPPGQPHKTGQVVIPGQVPVVLYERARKLALAGDHGEARRVYEQVELAASDVSLKALTRNDLAVLAAVTGDVLLALQGLEAALALDEKCDLARQNLSLLQEEPLVTQPTIKPAAPAPVSEPPPRDRPIKVAILSLLFNWPSTGGGNVHTAELALFLGRAGYDVRHFHARFAPWGIGNAQNTPFPSHPLEFNEVNWNLPAIQESYRRAVDAFAPDYVLITDCWNLKPHLARAMRGYPVLLRFQALECLCPLNNIRLLALGDGRWSQCPRNQLATPRDCADCLQQRGQFSGPLHQAERGLANVGTAEYHALLCDVLREAEAVLVLNPLTEAMLSPYASRVKVAPWGMDPARFPWIPGSEKPPDRSRKVIFQAGLVDEPMKGFAVLHAACVRLWQMRQDFELVATGEPAGQIDEFTRFVGWASQDELPRHYREADIVAVPTVAQEGLSRTSVEAMASGRPVVASKIGGLPSTVADGATGLLCEPGDDADLARKLETLLNDAELRGRMGLAGRSRFEEEFAWPVVIDRHYRPLFCSRRAFRTV